MYNIKASHRRALGALQAASPCEMARQSPKTKSRNPITRVFKLGTTTKKGLAPKSRPATPEAAECKQKTNRVEMTQWTGELCWSTYGREGENRQSEYGSRCGRQRQCETIQTDLRGRKEGRTARSRVLVLHCCCPRVRGSPRTRPKNKVRRNNNPLPATSPFLKSRMHRG